MNEVVEMKIGYLKLRIDGRYDMESEEGRYITYFTCGDRLELWDSNKEKWLSGVVEYKYNVGYYLLLDNNVGIELYKGAKVRV